MESSERTLALKKLFKKQQSHINKLVRMINDDLFNDEAFLGRIYLRQYSSGFYEFFDGSGGYWYGVIRIYDKETNTYCSVLCDSYSAERELYQSLNDFIVRDLQIDLRRALALKVDYRFRQHNPRDAEPFYPYYNKNFSYKRAG